MTIRLFFALVLAMFLLGCDKLSSLVQQDDKPPPGAVRLRLDSERDNNRYQLHATPDGKTYRLDTQTGQTSLVTDKGVTTLSDDRRVQLRVGEIYKLENGNQAVYEGNEKLSSEKRRVVDALLEKYTDKTGADKDRKPRAEDFFRDSKGQPIPPPPPGFTIDKK